MDTENWPISPSHWNAADLNISIEEDENNVTLPEILEKSRDFPIKFPITTVCCSRLKSNVSQEILEENINSVYPVLHEHAFRLCMSFLEHQKKFGPEPVRNLYSNMTVLQLIERFLTKRSVIFINSHDRYLLLNGAIDGAGGWEKIGTSEETPPLLVKDYLSYDEIKLSALLSVSSKTYFINDGDRHNCGTPEKDRAKVQDNGIIVGLIGPRLEKMFVMEYREIIKSREQNNHQYGYGQFFVPTLQGIFMNYYGEGSLTYRELEQSEAFKNTARFVDLGYGKYFDKVMYSRRLALSFDTFLIEANARAKAENKMAYLHVVGIGLGVWSIWSGQQQIFTDTFAKRVEFLGEHLGNISDICFAYIRTKTAGNYSSNDIIPISNHPTGGIKILFKNRNPHDKLTGPDIDKLLVVSYAWDGNALPGNEFWLGSLDGSGDPAAASSTQIAEIHNAHINRKLNANNLRIATLEHGLLTFKEFQALHKS